MSALPLIQGGGSLLLAWRIANKKVLIVGGGNVAAQRIVSLKCADAAITLVCPHQGLIPETRARIEQGEVAAWVDRVFQDSDLEDCVMVLTALDDHEESLRIGHLCRAQNIPVNVADVPPMCDFYFMSQHRDGPLQIAVSTNGQGPKLANMIRTDLANALPSRIGETIRKMGLLRAKVREWEPAVDQSSRRMGWVIRCCEAWGLETMAQWNDLTPSEEEAMYSVLYDYYQCNQNHAC
ncbi:putative siroheme synthase Met8 [Spinellus fusiger]|nr:putative siroheme synthase Met8 [Spinellus fusiger]